MTHILTFKQTPPVNLGMVPRDYPHEIIQHILNFSPWTHETLIAFVWTFFFSGIRPEEVITR